MANKILIPGTERFAAVGKPGFEVCVAVTGPTLDALIGRAASLLPEQPFLELRLDALEDAQLDPHLIAEALRKWLAANPQAQIIATCRRLEAGGSYAGSPVQELSILLAAVEAGCSLADLAVESADALGREKVAVFRAALHARGAGLLLSAHDFADGGSAVGATYQRLAAHQPDAVKLVTTANCLADNLPVLRRLQSPQRLPTVAIAMGEAGMPSRVLGPSRGGLFTFASAAAGAETAPGQATAATLRDLYRISRIGPATRVYGVAGLPISHSLSPLMHNTAFALSQVDAVFLPLPTGSARDLIDFARALPLHGLSVTMPLKQTILPLLDWVDPLAARVGACNTVVRSPDGAFHGYNTDVAGVVAPLSKRVDLRGARVLVQGAGGAARAAVFGLVDQGAEVWITNRTRATAEALAREAGAHLADPHLLQHATFDILVHAIPSPAAGAAIESGAPSPPPINARLVFEMVYNPRETPLVRQARAQGLPVITGEEMFVHQGARQFELWTGQPAPESAMADAVLAALSAREARPGPQAR